MVKYLHLALIAIALTVSCKKFDDSAIWDKLNNHESRIAYLEEVCENLNKEIVNIKTIIAAIESNDYVVSTTPLATGDGHVITFKSGKSIVIYNGKDGKDGKDGQNGLTPAIGVKKHTDGLYYWTLNGEWIIADGEKVKASGVDGSNGANGENGTNGTDGVTPKFKIEDEYWFVSYDNGNSWEKLGKAQGSDGLAGENGDSLFKRVFIENGCVCFEMDDTNNTIYRVPLMKDGNLKIHIEKEGTLSSIMSVEQTRSATSLTLSGRVNNDDMRYLQIMPNLQILDMKDAICADSEFAINPYQDTLINKSLIEITLPKNEEGFHVDFSYCLSLKKVNVSSNDIFFSATYPRFKMEFCPNVVEFEYLEGVTKYNIITNSDWKTISSLNKVIFPSSLTNIPLYFLPFVSYSDRKYSTSVDIRTTQIACKTFICKAVQPPKYQTYSNEAYYPEFKGYRSGRYIYTVQLPEDAVLYVPAESIELYKKAPFWENFTNIKPLPEEYQ